MCREPSLHIRELPGAYAELGTKSPKWSLQRDLDGNSLVSARETEEGFHVSKGTLQHRLADVVDGLVPCNDCCVLASHE